MDILLEVNIGAEESKWGFTKENLEENLREIALLPNLHVKGLMAMLPHSEDEVLLANLAQNMRAIYDKLKKDGLPFTYLSMGMSHDYKIAIKNGSNMIRLGRTIFGERNYGEIK